MECPRVQAEVCEAGGGASGGIQRAGGQNIQYKQYLKVIKFHSRDYLLTWRFILVLENVQTLKLHLYHHQGTLFSFILPRIVSGINFSLAKSVYLDTIPPWKISW